jgi:hypothetical protein
MTLCVFRVFGLQIQAGNHAALNDWVQLSLNSFAHRHEVCYIVNARFLHLEKLHCCRAGMSSERARASCI